MLNKHILQATKYLLILAFGGFVVYGLVGESSFPSSSRMTIHALRHEITVHAIDYDRRSFQTDDAFVWSPSCQYLAVISISTDPGWSNFIVDVHVVDLQSKTIKDLSDRPSSPMRSIYWTPDEQYLIVTYYRQSGIEGTSGGFGIFYADGEGHIFYEIGYPLGRWQQAIAWADNGQLLLLETFDREQFSTVQSLSWLDPTDGTEIDIVNHPPNREDLTVWIAENDNLTRLPGWGSYEDARVFFDDATLQDQICNDWKVALEAPSSLNN